MVGLLVLALGVGLLALGSLELPHPPTPLASSDLIIPSHTWLPGATESANHTAVALPTWPEQATSLVGNFTSSVPVSMYILTAQNWATDNGTQGWSAPPSFSISVAAASEAAWQTSTSGLAGGAILYLSPMGVPAAIDEIVRTVLSTGGNLSEPVPPAIDVEAGPWSAGSVHVTLNSTTSNISRLGGSFSGEGVLNAYVLNASDSRACSSQGAVPPVCMSNAKFVDEVSGSWSLVTGRAQGPWSVWYTTLSPKGFQVDQNSTAWSPPATPPLEVFTVIEGIGALLAFFGFLAIVGTLTKGAQVSEPRATLSTAFVTLAPGPRALQAGPVKSPEATATGEVATVGVVDITGKEVPVAGEEPLPGPRATCGLCGTGFMAPTDRTPCPVCGSRSRVDRLPTTIILR